MARKTTADGYHHGDLRRALLRSALELLRREGPAGLSLRAVAAAAGVSHAAPYHHFPSREALVAALASDAFQGLTREMNAALTSSPKASARARLVGLGAAYVRFATRHPDQFELMFGPILGDKARYPELAASAAAALAVLGEAVAAVVPPRDVADATLASWSLIHGLSTLMVDGALGGVGLVSRSPEATALALGELLERGLPTASPRKRA